MTSRRHLRLTHLLGRFHEAIIYVTLLVVLKPDCQSAHIAVFHDSLLLNFGSSDMRAHKSCQEKVRYCRGTGRRFTRISADSTPHQPRLAS